MKKVQWIQLKSIFIDQFKKQLGFDLRSLALYRMALAVLILLDLRVRFQDLEAHYAKVGIMSSISRFRSSLYRLWHLSSSYID